MEPLNETHVKGLVDIHNLDLIKETMQENGLLNDLGIQIAEDGRIWICINGIALLRFKPKR